MPRDSDQPSVYTMDQVLEEAVDRETDRLELYGIACSKELDRLIQEGRIRAASN